MQTRRQRTRGLLVAVALLLCAPGRLWGAPLYAERVRESMLPNGLKLILLEDHKAGVAVFQLWYRVGSRNEVAGSTGLSHMFEHLMFKGTETVGAEEYSRIIQRAGGDTNAFTSQDYTTYFAKLASDRLRVVIDLESDRLAHLKIDESVFGPERDVVAEERRLRTDNDPVSTLFEQLAAAAYTAHPYGAPVIGWMSDIQGMTLDDAMRHFRTYYVPNNAFVVAVGDFDPAALAAEIERAFGWIPSGSTPPFVRALEPPQQGERRVEVRRTAELPYVAAAYHTPNIRSVDAPALEVLAQVLSGGRSTPLHQELVYRRRIAREAGASYDFLSQDAGLFTVSAQPLPGKPASMVERALFDEIEKARRHAPSARALQKAKNAIEAQFVFSQDSLFYQGLLLGQFEINGDWRAIDEYLPAVRAVTADDVLRVARVYLRPENRTVATLVPLASTGPVMRTAALRPGPLH